MTVEKARVVRIVLFVVACLTFVYGLIKSQGADNARAHDLSKIVVELQSKNVYFNSDEDGYRNGAYHINIQYSIHNNTSHTICTLYVETFVYDKKGKELGTLKTTFGEGSNEGLWLEPGKTVTIESDYFESVPVDNDFFIVLYENKLSTFRIENKVISARFEDGLYFQNDDS